jgi:pyruvate dehydrogenase E2 component (dihydrolipoamide acetyltransferase)
VAEAIRVALEIPKVGLVMQTVKVLRWLKRVGETVRTGEPLLEVETEKSIVEIEATVGGRLVELLVQEGEQANVGDRIAWVESSEALRVGPAGTPAQAPEAAVPAAGRPAVAVAAAAGAGGRIRSSPVARRLAAEHGIDLAGITGSGPGGRVQLADVRRALEARVAGTAVPAAAAAAPAAAPQSLPLPPMRRALARAMSLSNATIPQFTLERAVDLTALQSARAALSLGLPPRTPRLSVNDFLLQAVARALVAYPALNAIFVGDPESADARIVPANGVHLGLVVAVENGLLVPVIHGVEQLGLAALARRRSDVVERALAGRLKREELEGATFSLSNLGARGPDRFAALINPPQSAILAVGRQRDCASVRGGAVQVRPICELTLTVDHRVADGRLAAEFLAQLCALLEGEEWLF